jgi:hypothetical protein
MSSYNGALFLLHSNLEVVDEKLIVLANYYYQYRKLDHRIGKQLNRILIQNVVIGCTVMINLALKNKVTNISTEVIIRDCAKT